MKLDSVPYVSPVLRYRPEARLSVIQYRDAETGEVDRQIPSESAVRRASETAAKVVTPVTEAGGTAAGSSTSITA